MLGFFFCCWVFCLYCLFVLTIIIDGAAAHESFLCCLETLICNTCFCTFQQNQLNPKSKRQFQPISQCKGVFFPRVRGSKKKNLQEPGGDRYLAQENRTSKIIAQKTKYASPHKENDSGTWAMWNQAGHDWRRYRSIAAGGWRMWRQLSDK